MITPKLELVGSVRERLLAAAAELFYQEGVHTVGIERVLERAGVAKASLYSTFGSKEELVRAYLEERAAQRRERIAAAIGRVEEPRARILAVFDAMDAFVRAPMFRGCAFVNASAEASRSDKVRQPCVEQRAWTLALFTELARDAGAADPALLAQQLVVIYDGAIIGAAMDDDVTRPQLARGMAEALISAATAGDPPRAGATARRRAGASTPRSGPGR